MRSHRLAVLAVAALLTLATAACGSSSNSNSNGDGGDGTSNDGTNNSSGSGSTGGSDSAGGGEGGEIAVAGQFPIESIDPNGIFAIDGGTGLASLQLYSPLLKTIGPGEFRGVVAEKWESNDTATEFTFTLKDGIMFSDGSPITGKDVEASFTRTVEANSPFSANFVDVGVESTDTTVTFRPAEPDPALTAKLTGLRITPAGTTEDSYLGIPVTSGPFKVKSFTPGGDLVMIPNDKFWGEKPKVSQATIRSITGVAAKVTALQTSELDIIWGISDDQLTQLQSNPDIKLVNGEGSGVMTMWMNASTPALNKAEVRRALWQAVDFDKIIKNLYPLTGRPADSVIAPSVFGYEPQTPVTYDPEAAKQALVDAGFDFDSTLRFHFSQEQFKQWVEAVASDLAAVGVKVDVLQKEQAVYTEDLLELKWDINIQRVGTMGLDASYNLGRLYTCEAKRTGYCNPDLDAMLEKAGTSNDQAVREQAYADAIELIWTEAVGMYPMFINNVYATGSHISGFTPDASGQPPLNTVSVDG